METELDQKDVDPMVPSTQTAAKEPEAGTHGDPIEKNVVYGSMKADEAPPFNMIRFLKYAQADRAAVWGRFPPPCSIVHFHKSCMWGVAGWWGGLAGWAEWLGWLVG